MFGFANAVQVSSAPLEFVRPIEQPLWRKALSWSWPVNACLPARLASGHSPLISVLDAEMQSATILVYEIRCKVVKDSGLSSGVQASAPDPEPSSTSQSASTGERPASPPADERLSRLEEERDAYAQQVNALPTS